MKPPVRAVASVWTWRRWWPVLIVLAAVAIPFLLLVPLGVAWLWQQGLLRWWLLLAAVLGAGGYATAAWLRRRVERAERQLADHDRQSPISPPDADWSPRDLAAWDKVQRLAGAADRHIVGDRDLLLAAARETIELVAVEYHPDPGKAVWRFTLPEALLLTERLSARLRVVLLDNVPGAHLVRIGQVREVWALRPAAQRSLRVFGHFAKVYRAVRLINPLGALMAEARDWLVGAALGETGDYLRRRGARIWIEEVGRAAIELYSGRLRVDASTLGRLAEGAPDLGMAVGELPGTLRLVVIGQINAGKSSLVNALLGEVRAATDVLPLTAEFTRYRLERDGVPEAEIVDAPGLERGTMARIVALACEADCLIWVVPAHRPDRALDRTTLHAVRARVAAEPERRMPPLIAVMSHVDRLSPAREWAPPYDIEAPRGPKATAIRAALESVAADLDLPPGDIVPARLTPLERAYNVDLIWALLGARFEAAQQGRVLRLLRAAPRRDWQQVLKQAGGAGRILFGRSASTL